MKTIRNLIRSNIASFKAYSSARSEFSGKGQIFLDANENPFGDGEINIYPDPYQKVLRQKLAEIKNFPANQIVFGNGSDELIDLLVRIFAESGQDSLIYCPPTFGMYKVVADLNDIQKIEIPLDENFQLSIEEILTKGKKAKLIFLCSPNNPTANLMDKASIKKILENFAGIVAIDEAYVDFSSQESWIKEIKNYPRLVVFQTFSKLWGLAGARMGMVFASKEIADLFKAVKPPYNTNVLSAKKALEKLENISFVQQEKEILLKERLRLEKELAKNSLIEKIFPSSTNFIFLRCPKANQLYEQLLQKGIIIRNFASKPLTKNCLRISVGTPKQNDLLLEAFKNITL